MISEQKNQQQQIAQVIMPQDLHINETQIFTVAPESIALSVRVQLQNSRQGTLGCKNRSAVTSRSNKKPWKQKGTGRARAGSPRSPLWRGGGKAHGPQPRIKELKVTRQLNRKILGALFWERLNKGHIIALDFDHENHKTSYASKMLSQAQLDNKKCALFVSMHDHTSHNAFANLSFVKMYLYDQPNVYTLADAHYWVFFKKDMQQFKAMVDIWI
jgi:large subunit ribosomal protein L4